MIECSGLDLLWWQWWLLVMITTNTLLNLVVFFKHRFRKEKNMSIKNVMINATRAYLVGGVNKHLANIEVYMNQTVGIGEHSDVIETIDLELDKAAAYHDKLEILTKYFPLEQTEEKTDDNET